MGIKKHDTIPRLELEINRAAKFPGVSARAQATPSVIFRLQSTAKQQPGLGAGVKELGRRRCSATAGRSGPSRCQAQSGPTQAASISPAAPTFHTPGSGHVAYLAADPNQNRAFSSPEPPSFPRPPSGGGGGGDSHRKHPPRRRWLAPGT